MQIITFTILKTESFNITDKQTQWEPSLGIPLR